MKIMFIQDKFKIISNVLIILVLAISTLPYTPLRSLYTGNNIQGEFIPILWGVMCIILWFLPRIHPIGRVRKQEAILLDAILCATFLLGCRLLASFLIDSFGTSPYDLSIKGILLNLLRVGLKIIAREWIRSYYLCTYCPRGVNKSFWIITILMAFTSFNMESFYPLSQAEDFVKKFSEQLGPEISISIILSYFGLYGGAKSALIYIGILEAFLRLSPILPNLQWITNGVIGIAIPVIESFYLSGKYEHDRQNKIEPKGTLIQTASWTLTFASSVLLIWFVIGVFPIYPSVIVTGSMRPIIMEGDVILIEKPTEEKDIYDLKEGDIIHFSRDEVLITHRIIEVVKDEGGNLSYRTKGDNNAAEDTRLVLPNEIRGILVKVIPKIGLPTLWLRTRGVPEPEGVEN